MVSFFVSFWKCIHIFVSINVIMYSSTDFIQAKKDSATALSCGEPGAEKDCFTLFLRRY